MTTPRAFVAFLSAALLLGCSTSDSPSTTPFESPRPDPTVSYDSGIGWALDMFEGDRCMQAHSQDLATPCVPIGVRPGSAAITRYLSDGTQLVMIVLGTDEHVSGQWASQRLQLDKPFVEVSPGVQVGVFPMDGDDVPQTVRVLHPDGTLRNQYPLDKIP